MSSPGAGDVHVNAPLGVKAKKPTKNKLSNMIIKEVSFCPSGMNQAAAITLYKAIDDNINKVSSVGVSVDMTLEDLKKALEVAQTENAALKKSQEDNAAQMAEFAKSLADLKAAADKKKGKAAADPEPDADDVGKAQKEAAVELAKAVEDLTKSNAELKKDNELQKTQLATEIAKRESVELAKRAEAELPNLVGTPEEKGKLLKAAEALGEDAVKILKSSDEAMAQLFTEHGTSAKVEKGGAEAQLETLAKGIAEAKSIPFAKAYDEALNTPQGAELYGRMEAAKKK